MKPKIKLKNDEYEKQIHTMSTNVKKYTNDLWTPQLNDKFETINLNMNTWFTIKEYKLNNDVYFKEHTYYTDDIENVNLKCKKILLILNVCQKNIINEWLNSYLNMYNVSVKYIKNHIKDDNKVVNFRYLRDKLKIDKQLILKKSSIKVHDLDYAIKLACQNYKSAFTNFRNKKIKHFRIRYWRNKQQKKLIDLEKNDFSSKGIRHNLLGEIKGFYNGKEYNFGEIKHDCRLQKNKNEYYLYVPENTENVINENEKINKQITIDPGIRVFGTGITENKIIKIGENCKERIKKYLERKDKIMKNEEINKNTKKKNERRINKKLTNLINELHWKTIKYLISENKTILIGNMSSKSIVKKNGNLDKITKRIATKMSFYKFKNRLKYKCNKYKRNYGEINEWMTSKMCSKCGTIKGELGGSKKYECEKCELKIERDINGARNIYIKGIKE